MLFFKSNKKQQYSNKTLRRFIKDFSLPIPITDKKYFKYYMNLYDDNLKIKEKYDLLTDTINKLGSEEQFRESVYSIRDNIIQSVKEKESYINFISSDFTNAYNINNLIKYSSRNIYIPAHNNHIFLSLDLEKANFQALKFFNKDIVNNKDTYEEFISDFTDLDYFKQSKYLRQVIFGNMNPKRQVKIERFIIQMILEYMTTTYLDLLDNIVSVSNDEIVFDLTSLIEDGEIDYLKEFKENKDTIKSAIKDIYNIDVRIELFKIVQIDENNSFFAKEFINDSKNYELKNIPLDFHAQAYKRYHGLSINKYDLSFRYQNQICRFNNNIFDK